MKNAIPYVLVFLAILAPVCRAGRLSIDKQEGGPGDTVSFSVSMESASRAVKAFIIDVHFDPKVLTFSGHERSGMAGEGYSMFLVNEYEPGKVRAGGVDPMGTAIAMGDSGPFYRLDFKVNGPGDSDMGFGLIKDDLEDWKTTDGQFENTEKTPSQEKKKENSPGLDDDRETGAHGKKGKAWQITTGSGGRAAAGNTQEKTRKKDSRKDNGQTSVRTFSQGSGARPASPLPDDPLDTSKTDAAKARDKAQGGEDDPAAISAAKQEAMARVQSLLDARAPGKNASLSAREAKVSPNPARTRKKAPPAAAKSLSSPETLLHLVLVLLVVVLVLLCVLLFALVALMAVALVFLILIYKKLKTHEKTGGLHIHGPLISFSASRDKEEERHLKTV